MKYIIDVPDAEGHYDNEYEMVTMRVHYGSTIVDISMDAKPYTEPDYKDIDLRHARDIENVAKMNYNGGAKDAWELADYMWRMGVKERDLCFGFPLITEVTANLSYQEAKDKFEAWLKQKDEIRVGDEVGNGFVKGTAFFVDEIMVEGFFIDDNEEIEHFWWNKRDCKKTGRHFDEVTELLEKMRGEEE